MEIGKLLSRRQSKYENWKEFGREEALEYHCLKHMINSYARETENEDDLEKLEAFYYVMRHKKLELKLN